MSGCEICGAAGVILLGSLWGDDRDNCSKCHALSWADKDAKARKTFPPVKLPAFVQAVENLNFPDFELADVQTILRFAFERELASLRMESRALTAEGECAAARLQVIRERTGKPTSDALENARLSRQFEIRDKVEAAKAGLATLAALLTE